MTALQRLEGLESTTAVVQLRARLGRPAGDRATGLLVTLAVAAMLVFAIGVAARARRGRRRSPESSSPSPPLAKALRQSTEDSAHRRPHPRRAAAAATAAARLYSRGAAAVPRALLRGRGARCLRARAGEDLLASDGGETSIGICCSPPPSEQGERFLATGAAPKLAIAGAQAAVAEHAGVNGHRAAQPGRATSPRGSASAPGVQIRDRRLRVVRARRRAARDLELGFAVARRAVAAYVGALGSYAASLPVAAPRPARRSRCCRRVLPAEEVMAPVSDMTRTCLLSRS